LLHVVDEDLLNVDPELNDDPDMFIFFFYY